MWFGGEDLMLGRPWYHEQLTLASAQREGWSVGAAADLAWYARRIDDYLYNPLWRLGGRWRRHSVRLVGPLLKNLHFDDLSTNEQVVRLWQRYTSGTAAAVIFAWKRDDIPAARNAIGVSLHAMQDFYSHSNWVDEPERRVAGWPELSVAARNGQGLWTGSFEWAPTAGTRPHGALRFGPAWAHSPGSDVHPARLLGSSWLAQLVRAEPGIALDSRWQSRVGLRERGVTDVSGDELFSVALRLARNTGAAWLSRLGEVMTSVGGGDFWRRVSLGHSYLSACRRQFEDPSQLPFAFPAFGAYPPVEDEGRDQTCLRLLLRSADRGNMAARAEVRVSGGGRSWPVQRSDRATSRLRSAGLHLLGPGPAPIDRIEVRAPVSWVLQSADALSFTRGEYVSVVDLNPGRQLDRVLAADEWFPISLHASEPVRVRLVF